jgi:hypothetical protein
VETSDYKGIEDPILADAVTLLPLYERREPSRGHPRIAYNRRTTPVDFEFDQESSEHYRPGLVLRLRSNWSTVYIEVLFMEVYIGVLFAPIFDQVALNVLSFITGLLSLKIGMLVSKSYRLRLKSAIILLILNTHMLVKLIFDKTLTIGQYVLINLSLSPLFISPVLESASLRNLANRLRRIMLEKQFERPLNQVPQEVPQGMTRGSWTCVSGTHFNLDVEMHLT